MRICMAMKKRDLEYISQLIQGPWALHPKPYRIQLHAVAVVLVLSVAEPCGDQLAPLPLHHKGCSA